MRLTANEKETKDAAAIGEALHGGLVKAINILVECARREGVNPRVILTAVVAETVMLSAATFYKMTLKAGYCDVDAYMEMHKQAIRITIQDHADA